MAERELERRPGSVFLSDRRAGTGGADLAIELKDGGRRVVEFAFQGTDGPIYGHLCPIR